MNTIRRIRRIRRFATLPAGLGVALAALAAAPAAFAMRLPPSGGSGVSSPLPQTRTVTHTVVVGGMLGWQIALIAVGAALLAATVAVLLDRARGSHRTAITAAA
jgi:hypothetical protein